ncbi:hypothetical protein HanHA300_Chr17g0664231 [Helianthus annuus]|nr:hypothetical protein HanHA300_Chr17g0664231 [Helianthus annuus]
MLNALACSSFFRFFRFELLCMLSTWHHWNMRSKDNRRPTSSYLLSKDVTHPSLPDVVLIALQHGWFEE